MTQPVKKRPYSSPVRAEQAALTRTRIARAADDLFVSQGYARTTMRQIGEAADVSTDTVYAVFGTKARVLTAVIDGRLSAPTEVDNVLDRTEALAVRDEPDQRRQLHLFAQDMAALSARVRPVYEILRTASAVDPEMAAIRTEMEEYRLRNMRQVASWIAAHGALRVDEDRAAEIIWVLASPDVARMLCDDRSWTQDGYANWLEGALTQMLLLPGGESP